MVGGRNPYDDWLLVEDLIRTMMAAAIFPPDSILIDTVVENWFANGDERKARKLIHSQCNDSDSPLEYVPDNEERIRLISREAAADYLRDRGGPPYWFD